MDELSETELSIMAYIDSHAPEECMLDKISRGTNKSRATVLKYLDQLYSKGLISYRYIGRNKLWTPGQQAEKAFNAGTETIKHAARPETKKLLAKAAELYTLKSKELSIKNSIDHPDIIIFSMNDRQDIVTSNDTFDTIFGRVKNLRDLVRPDRVIGLYDRLAGVTPGGDISAEVELMEKPGAYRPYHMTFAAITDSAGKAIGISAAGESLSGNNRTKRELEALLYIIREAGAAPDEKQMLTHALQSVRDMLLSYSHCAIFTRDGEVLGYIYQTFVPEGEFTPPANVLSLIKESMSRKETITAKGSDFTPGTGLMICIPLMDIESASGAILMRTEADAVSASSIENVEIVADELASGLRMHRLNRERDEYANTLLAMSRVSGIINGPNDEEALLERCIASTMDTLGFEMGCVYLTDASEELVLRVHRNLPESLRSMCISGMFKDLFSKAFRMNMPVYITADSADYAGLDPAIRANGVKTLLILPIKNGKKIIGLLNMGSRDNKTYNSTSLENLGSIGLQLGVALERTRLAMQLKEH